MILSSKSMLIVVTFSLSSNCCRIFSSHALYLGCDLSADFVDIIMPVVDETTDDEPEEEEADVAEWAGRDEVDDIILADRMLLLLLLLILPSSRMRS